MKIITLPLEDLAISKLRQHWTRKELPQPAEAHVDALSDTLLNGVQLPPGYLFQTEDGTLQLVAGETRRRAHLARQKDMQFFVITDEDLAMQIALGENTNRQSYRFKYQVAWVYCPLALRVMEISLKKRAENLRHARKCNNALLGESLANLDGLAKIIDVSVRLLKDVISAYERIVEWDSEHAPKCWKQEETPRTAVDYFTDRILDLENPATPGNCIAGLKGGEVTQEHNRESKQLDLFTGALKNITDRAAAWEGFDADQKRVVTDHVRRSVAAMPAELRKEFSKALKAAEREEQA